MTEPTTDKITYLAARSDGDLKAIREIVNGCQERSGRYVGYVEGLGAIVAITFFMDGLKIPNGLLLCLIFGSGILLGLSLVCFIFGSAHISVSSFIDSSETKTRNDWNHIFLKALKKVERLHQLGKWLFALSVVLIIIVISKYFCDAGFCILPTQS